MTTQATTTTQAARTCVSSDGVVLGALAGIHRDPATGAARWAVVDTRNADHRFLVVPLTGAATGADGIRVLCDAAQAQSAPALGDPTRMQGPEEAALRRHYGLGAGPATPAPAMPTEQPSDQSEPLITMIRHEEQVSVTGLEWRPYERMRIRKVVRTEEVTEVVTVRREELVVEDEPINAVERLEAVFGTAQPPAPEPLDIVLHREEYVVQKRIVPYERVHVRADRITDDWPLEGTLRKERIDVEREPIRTP